MPLKRRPDIELCRQSFALRYAWYEIPLNVTGTLNHTSILSSIEARHHNRPHFRNVEYCWINATMRKLSTRGVPPIENSLWLVKVTISAVVLMVSQENCLVDESVVVAWMLMEGRWYIRIENGKLKGWVVASHKQSVLMCVGFVFFLGSIFIGIGRSSSTFLSHMSKWACLKIGYLQNPVVYHFALNGYNWVLPPAFEWVKSKSKRGLKDTLRQSSVAMGSSILQMIFPAFSSHKLPFTGI